MIERNFEEMEEHIRVENFDFLYYWKIVKRRYPILIAIFIIVVLVTTIYNFQKTPTFEAIVNIQVTPDNSLIDDLNTNRISVKSAEFFSTQFEIIKSRSVIHRSIGLLLANYSYDTTGIKNPMSNLQQRLEVEQEEETQIINIKVKNKKPDVATLEANAIAQSYIQYSLESRREASKSAFTWLSEQLNTLKSQVKESELKLLKYKEKEDIVSLSKRQEFIENRISKTNDNYIEANKEYLNNKTILEEIKKLNNIEMAEYIPEIFKNNHILKLKQEETTLEVDLAKLSKKYRNKHPEIIRLQSQLDRIQQKLKTEIEKIIKSIEVKTKLSQTKLNSIKNNLDKLKRKSMILAKQAIQYGVLKREAESNLKMYDILLQKLKETDIGGNIIMNNIRIVDEAIPPTSPIYPKKKKNIFLSIIFGLALGLSTIIALDYFDNTIKTEEDAKNYLQEKVLGSIPKLNNHKLVRTTNDSLTRPYHELKTVISYHKNEHFLKTLMITSNGAMEGKTTTIARLGIAFAQSGSKVLLLDADVFKPKLHKYFEVNQEPGISDYYLEETEIHKNIISTTIPNLDILPAGLILPNPSEVIDSNEFKSLITQLKSEYDLILIDSPPVSAAIEVAMLGSFVDGIAFVVKANDKSWQSTKKVLDKIKSLKGNIIGTIITMSTEAKENYYYYSYGKEE